MPLLDKEFLRRVAREGVSANGSEGLGGHGDGFEVQNQGVTRRSPGEAPKVSESAEDEPESGEGEIELIDDPSWSEEEQTFGTTQGDSIKVQIGGRHPMDVLRTVAHELSHWEHGDTDGSDGSEEENRANAEAGENMRKFAKEFPEMFRNEGRSVWDAVPDPMQLAKEPVGPERDPYDNVGIGDEDDETLCPVCKGKEDPSWPCEACGGAGTYEAWLNLIDKSNSAEEPVDWRDQVDEEFMGVRDPDSLDKQDTRVGAQECGGPVAEKKIDPEELKKSSEKERKEHPWASKKIANRIARDHMKEHKITLKEFFQVAEARPGRYKYTDPQGKEYDQDAFNKHIDTNFPKKHMWDTGTGAAAEKELTTTGGWKKDQVVHAKPPLEQAVGKYIHVDQFSSITPYKIQEHGLTYDDLPEEMFKDGDSVYVDDDPNASWGSFVLKVGPQGELEVDSYNVDSSG